MSFLEPEADVDLERGPRTFDALAVLFIPVGLLRIGPAEGPTGTANPGALLGLFIVALGFVAAMIYSSRAARGPDEWVSRMWERACVAAVLGALVADLLWDLSASAHLIRPMSAGDLIGVQFITLGASWLWLRWRN